MIHQPRIIELRNYHNTVIVGQKGLLDKLVIGLLAGGHILVEGVYPAWLKQPLSKRWQQACTRVFGGYSSPPICCRAILPAVIFTVRRKAVFALSKGRCFMRSVPQL